MERAKSPESETIDLDVFDYTLKREKPKLGLTLVGQSKVDPHEDFGIYIGTIDENGDVAKDGRISKISKSINILEISFIIKILNMYFRVWRLSSPSQRHFF